MQIYKLIVGASSLNAGGTQFFRSVRSASSNEISRAGAGSGRLSMATVPQERSEVSVPTPGETGGVLARDINGHRSWQERHEGPAGAISIGPERSRVPSSTSQLGSIAPELLPLWLKHGHQVAEELALGLNLGGTLARVRLCEEMDRVSLHEACKSALPGLPKEASSALESLLCLQLKLSYLSAKAPSALKEYTHLGDPGGAARSAEAALLLRLTSEHSFPGTADPLTVLPFLAEHLELKLHEDDPQGWDAVKTIFERAQPWAVRTECLLVEGCDDRITVPYASGKTTNKYHCSPVPTPEVVSRSSCTSSSSSRRAFDSADAARSEVLFGWALKPRAGREHAVLESEVRAGGGTTGESDRSFSTGMGAIRRRLLEVLGMDSGTVEAFLTPSGSDAEFLPTALGLVRARRLGHKDGDGPMVTSIVVAAGEVGSGTAGAAGGMHFSDLTPKGNLGHPGHHVKGVSAGAVEVIQIKPRAKNGAFFACEEAVVSAVNKAMASSPTSIVVVHVVTGSKTGLFSPSVDTLKNLQQRFGERLLVVVDACQLRLEADIIRDYTTLGFLTLITGSKFYCAPPFCGAVLFPPAALAELEAGHDNLPVGFEDYFTRHEVDVRYPALRSRLPDWENRGLLLRWASALANMEAIGTIAKDRLDTFVGRWVAEVRDSIQDKWPYLSLLPEQRGVESCKALGGVNTVVSLVVRVPSTADGPDGNPEMALGYDDLRLFHRLLSEDITRLLPQDLSVGDSASARFRVLLGQPVKLGGASFGVVRIALGADMLIDAFPAEDKDDALVDTDGAVDRLITQDRLAINKCSLMARHWHLLKEAVIGIPPTAPRSKEAVCLETLATIVNDMGKDDLRALESLVTARQRKLP